MPGVQHLTVPADEAGQRVDRWFKRRFPQLTQGRIEKMLRKGDARVDGARAKAADRLEAGQVVRVPPIPDGEAPAPRKQSAQISAADQDFIRSLVLHKDSALIALNKPPGLPVQGGTNQTRHVDGLLDGLCFERQDRPRLVHRIDKDTSGVLLLARTVVAAAALAKAFHSRATAKTYWAALSGVPKPRMGTVRYALVKAPGHGPHGAGEKMRCIHPDKVEQTSGAKRSVSDYAVVEALGDRACWAALRPVTGRTHQLRAHMAEIGCPIVGDGKYGTNRIEREDGVWGAQLGGEVSRKLHLHARSLSIPHPDGGRLKLVAPLPEHMARTWKHFSWELSAPAAQDPFEDEDL